VCNKADEHLNQPDPTDDGCVPWLKLQSVTRAKAFPDAVLVLEGDDGGQIYVTCPFSKVSCDLDALEQLLADIDALFWREPRAARLYCFRCRPGSGESAPGGMGGGAVTDDLWVHESLDDIGLDKPIREVLEGRASRLRQPTLSENRAAAALGDARACYRLGLAEEGEGSNRWFRAAAELGHTGAMLCLSGEPDGIQWLEKVVRSTASRERKARVLRRLLFLTDGTDGPEADKALAAKWYERRCDLVYFADDAVRLGEMYRHGEGVPRDGVRALIWYLVGASDDVRNPPYWTGVLDEAGMEAAKLAIGQLTSELSAEDVAAAYAMAETWIGEHSSHRNS